MTACVYLVIALLIATKFCDAASTAWRIGHLSAESNPIARWFMERLGTTVAIWLVFTLSLMIIGTAGAAAVAGGNLMKSLFIVAGLLISIIQGAVAHSNWSGSGNVITRRIHMLHAGLQPSARR